MVTRYSHHVTTTPQSEPLPGQIANNAGGHGWQVNEWSQLDRFLILGTTGGSYYASERNLTKDNATAVAAILTMDALGVLARTVAISVAGRAPSNDPALFVMALASKHGVDITDALPQVARTGSHLLTFLSYVTELRGWGRGLRRAVARWYTSQKPLDLAYQLEKYRSREQWTHRDAIRLAHPKADGDLGAVLRRASGRSTTFEDTSLGAWLGAVDALTPTLSANQAARLIADHRLPREVVPTDLLQHTAVWEALLPHMPMTALVRNLATLTRLGLIAPLSNWTAQIGKRIGDEEQVRKARIHPIAVLSALTTYAGGRGIRGTNSWTPVQPIVDALDAAFYLAFGNLVPSGKRWLLGLDVSGSMDGGQVSGVHGLTPRVAAAAMAMVTARVESQWHALGFSHELVPVPITPRMRLDDVVSTMQRIPMGGTDCSLPILWATKTKTPVDVFVVYTDSETWAGKVHPAKALATYRKAMGLPAKSAVVSMIANKFSIADPTDHGMLDCVGFDTSTPDVLRLFSGD